MPHQYYKKDIYKSLEALLYGLYVYQYLLDTTTLGLILRGLVQEQFVSLKSKAPTLRIALYAIFATNILAVIRHLRVPERYAVIIDFIGNVSTPSRSKLLWLDLLICVLQITMALITFNVLKANISPRRTALSTGHQSRGRRSRGSNVLGNGSTSQRSAVNGSTMTPANTSAASSSSTTPGSTERVSGSPSVQSSSILFDYTPQSSSNTHGSTQGNTNPDYYVDEEEIRFSTEDNRSSPRRRQRRFSESASSGLASDSDHRSASEVSEDDDEDDDLLGNDYEEILDQETFVLQVRFKDLVSYLMSSQEAISFPRITNPRSTGSASAADLQAARTQNLPV